MNIIFNELRQQTVKFFLSIYQVNFLSIIIFIANLSAILIGTIL